MQFELINEPDTFQRISVIMPSKYNWKSCIVYFNVVIIFLKDVDAPFKDEESILKTVCSSEISLKLKK